MIGYIYKIINKQNGQFYMNTIMMKMVLMKTNFEKIK